MTSTMTFSQFVGQFTPIFNLIIIILAGAAVLVFFFGLVRYLFVVAGAKGKQEGRELIMWGLIALFVLFALGGIINFFSYDIFGKTVYQPGSAASGDPNAAFKNMDSGAFPSPAWTGVQADDPNASFQNQNNGVQTNGSSGAFPSFW